QGEATRPQPCRRSRDPVVAVGQPGEGERHVQRVAQVVVERVAGEVAGVAATEQRLEIVERLPQGREGGPRIAPGEEGKNGIPDSFRVFDVDFVGYVVFVTPLLQPMPLPCERLFAGRTKRQGKNRLCCDAEEAWETAGKPGSVTPTGRTRRGWQPFL